jgi:predicted nucleotidyltransferase
VSGFPAHLSAAEKGALADFLGRVRTLLGEELLDARLFGSRARGEGGEDSDLDVALIVTPRGRELRRDIHGLTFDAMYDYGVDVEPLVITEEQLRELSERELSIAAALERAAVVTLTG